MSRFNHTHEADLRSPCVTCFEMAEWGLAAEVWCSRCDQPSVRVVNDEAYCAKHGIDADFRLHSTAWNPSTDKAH